MNGDEDEPIKPFLTIIDDKDEPVITVVYMM
jgi:hypothetical protein